MAVKIKVPVKDLGMENVCSENVCSKVEEKLKSDSESAYTISGLMIEVFKVKKGDIENKPFKDWPKGLPTLYSRIGRCLNKLKVRGLVNSKKHGKAWVYWWKVSNVSVAIV